MRVYQITAEGETPETKTYTFTVWPVRTPEFDNQLVFDLDAEVLPEVTVQAGSTFFVQLNEVKHFPNGFAFEEPTHEFGCVKVLNTNFGNFNAGYRIWMLEAKTEVCTEKAALLRPTWWPVVDNAAKELIITVTPTTCAETCAWGVKRASVTSCGCVDVETVPLVGTLISVDQIAVQTTTRVVMQKNDFVTIREWVYNGGFRYTVDTSTVTMDCVEAADGSPVVDPYYQQITLKAVKPNCRWSYDLTSEAGTEPFSIITFEFVVMPEKEPEVMTPGELLLLDSLDWSEDQSVTIKASEYLTVRVVETATSAFGWEEPASEFKCVNVESMNYGDFNSGFK